MMYGVWCMMYGTPILILSDRKNLRMTIWDLRVLCRSAFSLFSVCHGGLDPPSPQRVKGLLEGKAPDQVRGDKAGGFTMCP